MTIMKHTLLLTGCLMLLGAPALAQPIEAVPLAPMDIKPIPQAQSLEGVNPEDSGNALPPDSPPPVDTVNTPPELVPPVQHQAGPLSTQPSPQDPNVGKDYPFYSNAPRGESPPRIGNKVFCDFKISFGSMGTGPDAKTGEQIKSYLDANADKLSYTRQDGLGKEGEYNYCLTAKAHNNRGKIYADMRRLFKKADVSKPNTGNVTLEASGFERIATRP